MFKVSKIRVFKKLIKYSLLTLFIASIYILLFGFHWTFSYDYINEQVQKRLGSKVYTKDNLVIEDPYIQYQQDEQFKISAHVQVDYLLISFDTNLELIGNISYKNGNVILHSNKVNIDNLDIEKMLIPHIPKEFVIYEIPEKYYWAQELLNKFLEKISSNKNGIQLTFKLI